MAGTKYWRRPPGFPMIVATCPVPGKQPLSYAQWVNFAHIPR